jgi:hypothetical protein
MMKRMLTSAKSSRLATIMRYKDYMPYHNEHCTVGTTYDAMVNGENRADRVCVSKKVSFCIVISLVISNCFKFILSLGY